ncbi:hypothetical protein FGADI_11270 [Fusarium gaditjirri]|uniref:Uncharacterized protein n=1 Tax=Fusarium gaditjirri TaxID=282569 RepID=A0A8H4SVH3_9HYPO|nr:hypothetical protein FGADI_11270 [Fusarium gaditjirri]
MQLAIISTLIDLQETQTLFAVTISLATIVAFHGYTGLANLASTSSYVLNNEIAHGVIIIGMSPLLLLQLVLHTSEHTSTYTLLFLILNWICIFIKSAWQKGGAAGFEETLRGESGVPLCGNNPGAMSYSKLHGFYEKGSSPNKGSRWAKYLFKSSCMQILVKKKALAILTVLLAIMAMAFGLTDLVLFYQGLRDRYNPEGGLPWSFAQITAVAIWSPVVFKFLYCCGKEDGVQARIDKDEYFVSRRGTTTSESKSFEESDSENISLIRLAVPGSMAGMKPIERQALLAARRKTC